MVAREGPATTSIKGNKVSEFNDLIATGATRCFLFSRAGDLSNGDFW
jgi:hypothetical protein